MLEQSTRDRFLLLSHVGQRKPAGVKPTSSSLTATALHKTCVPNLSLAMSTKSSLSVSQSRQSVSSLDRLNKAQFVCDLAPFQQLLAQVVSAGSIAKIFRPFNNSVDQDIRSIRFSRIAKTILIVSTGINSVGHVTHCKRIYSRFQPSTDPYQPYA
jgi:hypothetical protein